MYTEISEYLIAIQPHERDPRQGWLDLKVRLNIIVKQNNSRATSLICASIFTK